MSRKKVMVAMSGGVDSSTAAALLKQQGHETVGIGLIFPGLEHSEDFEGNCCGITAMEDARRVASRLGIPFHTLNYSQAFKEDVVDYFCSSYMEGKTPNPCVECNDKIKFGKLLNLARASGCDYLATGHYARIQKDSASGRHILKKGSDPEKDQSYFLYRMTREQLAHTLFPLGDMTKALTRKTAMDFGLHVSEKPGSQDVCFLGNGDYRKFLSSRFPEMIKPGPIKNSRGEILGEHRGTLNFTVGQRRGIGVAGDAPMYVLSTDVDTNTVVVGRQDEMRTAELNVIRTNWIVDSRAGDRFQAAVRTRYRQKAIDAEVMNTGGCTARISFSEPCAAAAAPGQSAVFYKDDVVLGGGIIT